MEEGVNNDTDQNGHNQEAAAAAVVQGIELLHILHGKLHTGLVRADHLMLRPVVLK
ncbi:hypothetical protein D3C75_1383200 [compost metagenome]